MKSKISITVEKELLEIIDKYVLEGSFRNKSHVIEYSIKKFLENKEVKK